VERAARQFRTIPVGANGQHHRGASDNVDVDVNLLVGEAFNELVQ